MALGVGRVGWRSYVAPPPTSTLYNNLIHAWNANGNANDSVGSLNGTLINGALANASPKMGSGAFYFDRINDYISLQDNSLNLDTDFTVSFWCKDGYGGINRMIIHNCYFANDAYTSGWMILYGGNGIEVDIWNNGAIASLTTTADSFAPYRTNWNHVTVKYTRGVKIEIFLNGVLNSTKNTTLLPSYTRTPIKTSIGSWNSLYSPTLYLGDGLLDDLNIWDRALTNSEITELYNLTTELAVAPVTAPAPTYPSSLKFFIDAGNTLSYSGTGTTVTDLTGTQNGTLVNGTSYSSADGGTFVFDGINDYIDFGINTAIQPVSSGTYLCWVKFNGSGTIWSFSNYTVSRGGILVWYDNNGLRAILTNSVSSAIQPVQFNDGSTAWKYVTVSFDGTTVKTYINGVLKVTTTQTVVPNNGLFKMRLGNTNGEDFVMTGKISQMKIYNEARTDAEVLTDFNEFKSRYGY